MHELVKCILIVNLDMRFIYVWNNEELRRHDAIKRRIFLKSLRQGKLLWWRAFTLVACSISHPLTKCDEGGQHG